MYMASSEHLIFITCTFEVVCKISRNFTFFFGHLPWHGINLSLLEPYHTKNTENHRKNPHLHTYRNTQHTHAATNPGLPRPRRRPHLNRGSGAPPFHFRLSSFMLSLFQPCQQAKLVPFKASLCGHTLMHSLLDVHHSLYIVLIHPACKVRWIEPARPYILCHVVEDVQLWPAAKQALIAVQGIPCHANIELHHQFPNNHAFPVFLRCQEHSSTAK